MPKNSVMQIQKDEKKILEELSKNAHSSINEIANKLGFSRQKVWRIIKNLENDKTIWGYTAIIDDNKIGVKRFCILLKKAPVKVTDKKTGNTYRRYATRAKIAELRSNPNISSVEMTHHGEQSAKERKSFLYQKRLVRQTIKKCHI